MDQGEDIGEIPLPIEINIADKKEKGEHRTSGFHPSFSGKFSVCPAIACPPAVSRPLPERAR